MKYKCEKCDYITENKSNYNRHMKSNNHIQKETDIKTINIVAHNAPVSSLNKFCICEYCNKTFSKQSNLTRHENICCKKVMKEREIELENKFLKKQNEELKAYIKSNKYGSTNNTINISVKNYIKQNYPDAPALLAMDNYDCLTYEPDDDIDDNDVNNINEDDDIINENEDDENNEDNENNEDELSEEDVVNDLVTTLIYHYKNNTLHKYLGNFLIKNYKKKDPALQAMWNSDVSRLTYIIKELLGTKQSAWHQDPKGIKTKNCIITPLLQYVKEYINDYWITNIDLIKTLETSNLVKVQENLITVAKIKDLINNDELANNIIKYIAPHFYIKKSTNMLENNEDSDSEEISD